MTIKIKNRWFGKGIRIAGQEWDAVIDESVRQEGKGYIVNGGLYETMWYKCNIDMVKKPDRRYNDFT